MKKRRAEPEAPTAYTSQQLIDEAKREGFQSVNHRLITDWVSRGLLGAPTKRGLGRAKGTVATWPKAQRDLFALLLRKRREGTKRGTLTNIPVFIWLYWGEDFVPLRQARKALATWCSTYRSGPDSKAGKAAKDIVRVLAAPGTPETDKRRFAKLISDSVVAGTITDLEAFKQAARRVIPSEASRRLLLPTPLSAEGYVSMVVSRRTAIDRVLNDIEEMPDDLLLTARRLHLAASDAALSSRFRLLAAPGRGDTFEISGIAVDISGRDELLSEMLSHACRDFLTTLGYLIEGGDAGKG